MQLTFRHIMPGHGHFEQMNLYIHENLPNNWIAILPFLRRWKMLVKMVTVCIFAFGWMAICYPNLNQTYWFQYLPKEAAKLSTKITIDDQSLNAWLMRLGKSNSFSFPGLDVRAQKVITWDMPWQFWSRTIRYINIQPIVNQHAISAPLKGVTQVIVIFVFDGLINLLILYVFAICESSLRPSRRYWHNIHEPKSCGLLNFFSIDCISRKQSWRSCLWIITYKSCAVGQTGQSCQR